jgi:hypothetical protein
MLADNIELLRRPVGFAVGVNREEKIDVAVQRERLVGLMHFIRTFASAVLDEEFGTPIEGYPDAALERIRRLRDELRAREGTQKARRLLSVLIDLIEAEADYEDASPDDDAEEQESLEDLMLVLMTRLLTRLAAWAEETGRLPLIAAEAKRGADEWHRMSHRLDQ